ncbi:MAG: AlkZ family DNA glycosylase [Deltaproteobacteria bacterium]|nr:AlkZ family DNA glycosylase [Deltaproteobacteria bacterium]
MKRPASRPDPLVLSREEARAFLTGQLGLLGVEPQAGAAGVRSMLAARRAVQLDPLDPMGNNADLVALARVDGLAKGDLFRHVFPGHAFEHFAKERCLLPAAAFPYYRDQSAQTPWWRLGERLERLPKGLLEKVLEEVREKGPATAGELTHHGPVEPIDWAGWKGTGRATAMALEVLWTRCQIVVCGRRGRDKLFDIPERALPEVVAQPGGDFERWALLERVEAAGLLARAGGAHWSMLSEVRTSPLPDQLVEEGLLVPVRVEGAPREYLAPAALRARRFLDDDARMRILGPLDPLLWDRLLVRHAFDFEYVWEVYKPAALRKWGWYVCPLRHHRALVGRLEGRLEGEVLKVLKIWRERGVRLDEDALDEALARHAAACGAQKVKRPPRLRRV